VSDKLVVCQPTDQLSDASVSLFTSHVRCLELSWSRDNKNRTVKARPRPRIRPTQWSSRPRQ